MADERSVELALADEAATIRLAEDITAALKPGDVLALSGELGAGKTAVARAMIRALADRPAIEVPSPTYTLVQIYDLPRFPVAHVDLYRLADPSELDEIGFEEQTRDGVVLVEWPERAEERIPPAAIRLRLDPGAGPMARRARLSAEDGPAWNRLERSLKARALLDRAGFPDARRRYLQGDASARGYERISAGRRRAVLLDHAPESDDPAGRARRLYRAEARLAEDMSPFVAIARALHARGVSVPQVYEADVEAGLAVLEDLGTEPVVAGTPARLIAERYRVAAELLGHLHGLDLPAEIPGADAAAYRLPALDRAVLHSEVSVLIEWGFPFMLGRAASATEAESFRALWDDLFDRLPAEPETWVLRDFHSPNLLWLGERSGTARIGVLDFQDAVRGPAAYDLASLLQDARATVPAALEADLFEAYLAARRASSGRFDEGGFRAAYTILAAQRATRLCGLFPRLWLRDGRQAYLAHLPRVSAYLDRLFEDPALHDLKLWYQRHLPAERRIRHAGS